MIDLIRNIFEFFFYTSGENFSRLLGDLRETQVLYEFFSFNSSFLHLLLEITALTAPIISILILRSKFLGFFLGTTICISAVHIKTVLNCLIFSGPPYCSSEDFEGTTDLAMKIASIFYVLAILICISATKIVLQNKIELIKEYLRGRK